MVTNPVLTLSVLSQNDPGTRYSSRLTCSLLNYNGGFLADGSSATDISIPVTDISPDSKASWFLLPEDDIHQTSITLVISCPDDPTYPACPIIVRGSDILKQLDCNSSKTKVYQRGAYGITGHAEVSERGPVFVITAGIYNPH
ncbi:hypothetical protein [Oceanospirillum sediminis]|uniref:Uncharacterized protein n=1 Tax=Oceanospirillum sediminis TaxID=2760088 RepID=A0A839IW99_9GAMM|nr:hypothetical protein [Oceanospirillum sediminis]MBB1488729.1 hypothetical protein [Oceanospirillum sediminis]